MFAINTTSGVVGGAIKTRVSCTALLSVVVESRESTTKPISRVSGGNR